MRSFITTLAFVLTASIGWVNASRVSGQESGCSRGDRTQTRNATGRRTIARFAVTALVLVSFFAVDRTPWDVFAQEATPPNDVAPPLAGVTVELLDSGQPLEAPGKVLNFVRLTFEPGGYFNAHGHPGAQIWYIDTGTIGTTILEGTVRLIRAPAAEEAQHFGPGDAATLSAGDSIFFDSDVVHTVVNAGDDTAVILISALLTAGEPEVIFSTEHAHDSDNETHQGTPAP